MARYSIILAALGVVVGCGGPQLGRVEGTVLLDGEPIEQATVTFQPNSGPSSYGITDHAGHFELRFSRKKPGAVLGKHSVTVETYRVETDEQGEIVEHAETIPRKYNHASNLSANVVRGRQTIDFKLNSK